MIGLRPFGFKLIAFVLASFLATLGGIVWLLLIGGATPEVTTANFTLTLLVMVVLGGAGTRYGAMLGGFLYMLLDQRLGSLAGSTHGAGSARRCCGSRSRSRCSCSARSSSCSSSSRRAGSRASPRAAARRCAGSGAAARGGGAREDRVGAARRGASACS